MFMLFFFEPGPLLYLPCRFGARHYPAVLFIKSAAVLCLFLSACKRRRALP